MSRKREPGTSHWAKDRLMQAAAGELLEADDATITRKAAELEVDPRRLAGFVDDARRQLRAVRAALKAQPEAAAILRSAELSHEARPPKQPPKG